MDRMRRKLKTKVGKAVNKARKAIMEPDSMPMMYDSPSWEGAVLRRLTIHATTGMCFCMKGSTCCRTWANISSSLQGASATR